MSNQLAIEYLSPPKRCEAHPGWLRKTSGFADPQSPTLEIGTVLVKSMYIYGICCCHQWYFRFQYVFVAESIPFQKSMETKNPDDNSKLKILKARRLFFSLPQSFFFTEKKSTVAKKKVPLW